MLVLARDRDFLAAVVLQDHEGARRAVAEALLEDSDSLIASSRTGSKSEAETILATTRMSMASGTASRKLLSVTTTARAGPSWSGSCARGTATAPR